MGTLNILKPPEKSADFFHSNLRLSHQEGKKDVFIMQTFIILNFWKINREVVEI